MQQYIPSYYPQDPCMLYMVTWIQSIYPQCQHIYHTWILWVIVGCLPVIALDAVWIGNTTSRQSPCKQGEVQVNRNQVRAGYRNIFTLWDPEDRQVGFILLTSKNHMTIRMNLNDSSFFPPRLHNAIQSHGVDMLMAMVLALFHQQRQHTGSYVDRQSLIDGVVPFGVG